METRRFTVPGEPRGKGRPRFTSIGGFPKAYTDSKTAAYENLVALEYEKAYPNAETLEGAIRLEIWAYFPLNKTDYWPNNKKHHGELRQSGIDKINGVAMPTGKPDADNLKSVADGLNHTNVWRDDSHIVDYIVHKRYSEKPRLEVEITEL